MGVRSGVYLGRALQLPSKHCDTKQKQADLYSLGFSFTHSNNERWVYLFISATTAVHRHKFGNVPLAVSFLFFLTGFMWSLCGCSSFVTFLLLGLDVLVCIYVVFFSCFRSQAPLSQVCSACAPCSRRWIFVLTQVQGW